MTEKSVFHDEKAGLSFTEQKLLQGAFDALHASPDRVEEIIRQAKKQDKKKPV